MVLYQIIHTFIGAFCSEEILEGEIFVSRKNAERFVEEYQKYLMVFEEKYGMDMEKYEEMYNEAVDLVSAEGSPDLTCDEMKHEVLKVLSKQLNMSMEEIAEMDKTFDSNADLEQPPYIIEVATCDSMYDSTKN